MIRDMASPATHETADLLPTGERLIFDGLLTLRTVEALQTRLADALATHDHLIVDCSAATEVDLSVVQLLLAARRTAADDGKTLLLAQPAGEALDKTLRRGGFLDPAGGGDIAFWLKGPGPA